MLTKDLSMTLSRSLRPAARLRCLALLGLALLPHTAHAQTFISNDINQNLATSGSGNNLNDNQTKAYGFTTAALSNFQFTSATISLTLVTGTNNTVSGGIYADSGGNPSSTQLVAFNTVSVSSGGVNYRTFTPVSTFQLTPNTTYWVRFFSTTAGAGTQWNAVPSTFPTATGDYNGLVTLLGYKNSNTSGASWGTSTLTNGITITLVTLPEPGTFALLALGLVGGVIARRRK
nr:choice-of-anchor R domain-containing protein [Armatimonas rosea]